MVNRLHFQRAGIHFRRSYTVKYHSKWGLLAVAGVSGMCGVSGARGVAFEAVWLRLAAVQAHRSHAMLVLQPTNALFGEGEVLARPTHAVLSVSAEGPMGLGQEN